MPFQKDHTDIELGSPKPKLSSKKRCSYVKINKHRKDFVCTLPEHGDKVHIHTDGTRWRDPGVKKGKPRPYGIPKRVRTKIGKGV